MIKKLSKKQILDLYKGLNSVGHLKGVKFAYAVARNISKLQPEIEALQKAKAPPVEYIAYDKQRQKLAEDHAVKKEGLPQFTTERGVQEFVIEDEVAFDKALKALRLVHKDAIDKYEKQLKDFDEIAQEETEVELYTIPPQYVPEDIKAQEMAGILVIIEEDSNSDEKEVEIKPTQVN